MKHFLRLLVLILFSAFATLGQAYEYSSMHISSDDGLSQNNVKSIVQDQRGFMWFGTKNGLNRFDGYRMVRFFIQDKELQCGNQNVSALYCAPDGLLWIGTDEGVYTYDSNTNIFKRISLKAQDGNMMTNWVSNICQTPDGTLWFSLGDGIYSLQNNKLKRYFEKTERSKQPVYVTTCTDGSVWCCSWNHGLFHYDPQRDDFRNIRQDAQGTSLLSLQANTISQQDGDLIIGAQNGHVMRYNMRTNIINEITTRDFSHDIVRNAMAYGDEIWVGTYNGLYIVNEEKNTCQQLTRQEQGNSMLADNLIYCTYRDRDNGTWIGTMFGGVNYLTLSSQAFQRIQTDNDGYRLKSLLIRNLLEDNNHQLWITAEDGGVMRYDVQTKLFSPVTAFDGKDGFPMSLTQTPNGIACSFYKNDVMSFYNNGDVFSRNVTSIGIPSGNSIYKMEVDPKGRSWVASDAGAFWIDENFQHSHFVKEIGSHWIYDIAIDHNGNIWFASMGGGVWRRDGKTGKIQHFSHDEKNPHSLSSNSVSAITLDHNGNAWFSTDRGGICRYNANTNDFTHFSIAEGLPDDVAYKIVEDNDGYLWFGTNHGLVRLNPARGDVRVFTTRDGLPSNQFNYCGGLLASDGRIYMATTNGLLAFSTRLDNKKSEISNIFFTNLSIAGVSMMPNMEDSPLKESIFDVDRIVLKHDQTNFSLDVSTLVYSANSSDTYEYKLLPADKEWHAASFSQPLSFANLAPGEYHLHIRVPKSITSNEYTERILTIVVRRPWWSSYFAITLYLLTLIGLGYYIFICYRRHKEREFQERHKIFAIEKEKELYKNKVEFFTQVAHEVRTPLTLINGPVEIIRSMDVKDDMLKKNLDVIDKNTRRLLHLTTQLLDFQKVDADHLQFSLEQVNISELVMETVNRFEPAFAVAKKQISIAHLDNDVIAMIDREAVTKILSNLFNNARKYSENSAAVSLVLKDSQFTLSVVSDGTRIPADKAETIFEPFVRLNITEGSKQQQPGTGIGLPLARSLAKLHNGHLFLDTSNTEGNAFILTIPLNNEEAVETQHQEIIAPADQPFTDISRFTEENSRGKSILLVEDEEGIRQFMAERLMQDFVVETAENGVKALEILQQGHVDLVISDIMMPEMDGYELCRRLKSNERTSHIPIVFLTAKNDLDSKIEGLKAGAEAYIEKPFSYEYLCTQINSLLENREKEREAFSKRPFFPIDNIKMSREDEEMMQKILAIINENLQDESFNVERLADEMCMSRSSLLRKIKQLFNMPPLEFIRLVRLKRAAELIQEGNHRIGEIGYIVGFGNPSYFAKMFCRQFGVNPKDFEQQLIAQRKKQG